MIFINQVESKIWVKNCVSWQKKYPLANRFQFCRAELVQPVPYRK